MQITYEDLIRRFKTLDLGNIEDPRGLYFEGRVLINYEDKDLSSCVFYRCFPQVGQGAIEIEVAQSINALNLRRVDLEGVNLQGANLERADLRGANLYYANLKFANLCNANLKGANLKNANLKDANLEGANLEGADLDYSCFPIWCGGKNITTCEYLPRILAAFICSMDCKDKEIKEMQKLLKPYALKSRRAKDILGE